MDFELDISICQKKKLDAGDDLKFLAILWFLFIYMDRVFYLIHLNKASMTLLRNLTKMLNVLINANHKAEPINKKAKSDKAEMY